MELQFWGGVRSVTGSMHLIEVNNTCVLLDCGLFQGRRQESRERNEKFPFEPQSIDAIILSHAHIDHSGNIPGIVRQGFSNNIYTTSATRNLCSVMLKDSAHIQAQDAIYLNKKHNKKGLPPVVPLYDIEDVQKSMNLFIGVPYQRTLPVSPDISVTFFDAGHILGAGLTLLEIHENGRCLRLAYVVDLGRKHLPLLEDPIMIKDSDIMLIESTYGNRLHDNIEDAEKQLAGVINRTYQRGGKVIIPAFALGRTQAILYFLQNLMLKNQIPQLPIYVDSPLAVDVTEVFRLHAECFDAEAERMLAAGHDPLYFKNVKYIRDVEASKALNADRSPMIIISASGMCETGRILHHLKHNIEDSKNTILIVSWMAENTLGRKLVEKQARVKIFGEEYALKAEVVVLNAFSAHADRDDLVDYISQAKERCSQFFIVHGEENQSLALADKVKLMGISNVQVPHRGEEIVV